MVAVHTPAVQVRAAGKGYVEQHLARVVVHAHHLLAHARLSRHLEEKRHIRCAPAGVMRVGKQPTNRIRNAVSACATQHRSRYASCQWPLTQNLRWSHSSKEKPCAQDVSLTVRRRRSH